MATAFDWAVVFAAVGGLDEPAATPLPADEIGWDLDCTDDLAATMRLVSGPRLLAQAVYRRITTPRGSLLDDENYGLDVRAFLHKGLTPQQLAAIPSQLRAEIERDERIARADVAVAWNASTRVLTLTIRCTSAAGPFLLTVDVTEAAVKLTSTEGV